MRPDCQAFKLAAGLLPQVNTQTLLSFVEYLSLNHHSKANIASYMDAIIAFHIIYGLETILEMKLYFYF